MTNNDIKKAFEQMKKELKKETGICNGFVMNRKQIENRTATKTVTYAGEYDEVIEFYEKQIERVKGYETWTDEEKGRAIERDLESINALKELKKEFGTKSNQVRITKERIENSNAFKKFEDTIGKTSLTIEIDADNCYKIRFNY